MTDEKERGSRRMLQGVVVSDKATKTVTVAVERFYQHATYKKYIRSSKKYMAHDEKDEAHVGDTVQIVESRPLSARKRWRLVKIVKRAE
jgi:small subunit ribosomal protein S17